MTLLPNTSVYNVSMNKKLSADASTLANGEQLKPTPELERLLRERFSPEGKEERIAHRIAALKDDLPPIRLTREQWKALMENEESLEQ